MSEKFNILDEIFNVVTGRKANPKEGSYTNYLFDKGIDKICKKVGEESAEVIIAAKNNAPDEIRYEIAYLLYHLTVLMVNQGLTWDEVMEELKKRR
jgi:phosphoribosyl-ATP pyrophosphohydrolase